MPHLPSVHPFFRTDLHRPFLNQSKPLDLYDPTAQSKLLEPSPSPNPLYLRLWLYRSSCPTRAVRVLHISVVEVVSQFFAHWSIDFDCFFHNFVGSVVVLDLIFTCRVKMQIENLSLISSFFFSVPKWIRHFAVISFVNPEEQKENFLCFCIVWDVTVLSLLFETLSRDKSLLLVFRWFDFLIWNLVVSREEFCRES